MKINVEIDCTPDEARSFFGLPDLKPMQTAIMGKLEERMMDTLNNVAPAMMRAWLPYWMPFGASPQDEGHRSGGTPKSAAGQPANGAPTASDRRKSE